MCVTEELVPHTRLCFSQKKTVEKTRQAFKSSATLYLNGYAMSHDLHLEGDAALTFWAYTINQTLSFSKDSLAFQKALLNNV